MSLGAESWFIFSSCHSLSGCEASNLHAYYYVLLHITVVLLFSMHSIHMRILCFCHYVRSCEVLYMYFWFIEGKGVEIESAHVQCSNIIFAATCI